MTPQNSGPDASPRTRSYASSSGLGDVAEALLPTFAEDAQRPGATIDVREIEGGQLGAAEAGNAQDPEPRAIAHAGRRRVVAHAEHGDELGRFDVSASGEALSADPIDVGDQGVRVGGQQTEAHGLAGDAAHGAEDLVHRRGGETFGEAVPEDGNDRVAESGPGDRVWIGRAELDGDDREGAAHGDAALLAGEAGEVDDDRIAGEIGDGWSYRQRRDLGLTKLEENDFLAHRGRAGAGRGAEELAITVIPTRSAAFGGDVFDRAEHSLLPSWTGADRGRRGGGEEPKNSSPSMRSFGGRRDDEQGRPSDNGGSRREHCCFVWPSRRVGSS